MHCNQCPFLHQVSSAKRSFAFISGSASLSNSKRAVMEMVGSPPTCCGISCAGRLSSSNCPKYAGKVLLEPNPEPVYNWVRNQLQKRMIPNGAQIRQQRSKTADIDRLCPAFSGKRLHEHQGGRNFKGSRCFRRVVPEYFPHQGRCADRADRHDVQQAVRRGKAAGGKRPPRRCTSTRWKRLCSWR